MIDERCVSLENNDSNFKQLKDYFFSDILDKGLISSNNLHPYDHASGLDSYNSELEKFGGKFDIAVLSAGEDGHVASLFPHHEALKSKKELYVKVNNSPKPPSKRISATVDLIRNTDFGYLVFMGKKKSQAYELFQEHENTFEDCPAKLIHSMSEYLVFVDLEA